MVLVRLVVTLSVLPLKDSPWPISPAIVFALVFARVRAVRVLCAFLRSVHELFWALLLIQIAGLSAMTGILAVAIPYSGIFAKVFAEMIEEADLSAERVLPVGDALSMRLRG